MAEGQNDCKLRRLLTAPLVFGVPRINAVKDLERICINGTRYELDCHGQLARHAELIVQHFCFGKLSSSS